MDETQCVSLTLLLLMFKLFHIFASGLWHNCRHLCQPLCYLYEIFQYPLAHFLTTDWQSATLVHIPYFVRMGEVKASLYADGSDRVEREKHGNVGAIPWSWWEQTGQKEHSLRHGRHPTEQAKLGLQSRLSVGRQCRQAVEFSSGYLRLCTEMRDVSSQE